MNNNPLRHVGQTARPEESSAPDSQSGDAGAEARQQNPSEAKPQDPKAKKKIPDLKPGEPPPESSAGS
jgi:hypothetical protein